MIKRTTLSLLLAIALTCPFTLFAQQNGAKVDAVTISQNYGNSIVKILIYDSVMAKTNPDLAYMGRGSGFFVTEDGYIFTNRHVIDLATRGYYKYTVHNNETKKDEDLKDLYSPSVLTDPNIKRINYVGRGSAIVQVYTDKDGNYKLYYGKVVAMDTGNFDGAIVKIVSDLQGNPVTDKFHPIPLGNSDSAVQGEDLCIYGFPAQYNGDMSYMLKDMSTLVFGKHSGSDYAINTEYGFIKTDASINSGNSGGPVFGNGNVVIGIATAAFEKTNIGLVGGINGMYNLVALIPDLQKQLAGKIMPADHKPAHLTTKLYVPYPLPTKKKLRKINHTPIHNSSFNHFMLVDISLSATASGNEVCTLAPMTTNRPDLSPYGNTMGFNTPGGNFNIRTVGNFGINFKFSAPSLIRYKNNALGLFVRLSGSEIIQDWSTVSLYGTDSAGNKYPFSLVGNSAGNLPKTAPQVNHNLNIGGDVGIVYTYRFTNMLSISAYYSIGIIEDFNNEQIAVVSPTNPTNGYYYPGTISDPPGDYVSYAPTYSSIPIEQYIGLTLRFHHIALDVNYAFGGSENIQLSVRNYSDNITQSLSGSINNRNSVNVSLGFQFNRKKGR